jgi:uncharacterized protein YxjI
MSEPDPNRDQIAKASSSNAMANRRFAGSSTRQFVMAAANVLDEGMPGDDYFGVAVLLESTHRSQARLQPAVICSRRRPSGQWEQARAASGHAGRLAARTRPQRMQQCRGEWVRIAWADERPIGCGALSKSGLSGHTGSRKEPPMPRTPSDPYEQYPDQRYGYQQHPDHQPAYQEYPDQRYADQRYAQQQYPDQGYPQQQYPDQRYAQEQYGQQHYSYRYQQAPAVVGRLMDHSSFIVDQKAKLIELRNEYSIYDDGGNTIGSVKQIGQSALIRVLRLFIKTDSLLGITLEIREASGAVALLLRKPAFRITCTISSPNGTAIGRIAAKIRVGKVRMAIADPSGNVLGEIRAENLRAWNFNVQDAQGRLIARVDKKWAGARELFTTADKYRVELDPNLGDPLRSLVVASCLAIDTLLKQQQ